MSNAAPLRSLNFNFHERKARIMKHMILWKEKNYNKTRIGCEDAANRVHVYLIQGKNYTRLKSCRKRVNMNPNGHMIKEEFPRKNGKTLRKQTT